MFIKIRFSNVLVRADDGCVSKSELDCEHVYDCNHFALFPVKPVPPEVDVTEMHLVLEFNKSGPEGWDRTISFPSEGRNQVVEIFIMNEHGKTIDRYIY